MMAMASRAIEYEWDVPRHGGGRVSATRLSGQTVINVDRTQEAALPEGAKLLSAFLDQFDAEPDIAEQLPAARAELAAEISEEYGSTIRSLRLAKGLSQRDLAIQLQTSQSRVSLIESRKEKPSEDTLRALSTALGVDFNTIMDALSRADQ